MRRVSAIALAIAITLPTAALPWRAWNRHEVLPVSDGVWEVVARPGSAAKDFWCGIGDYAIHILKIPSAQRLYIWKPIGPSVNRSGYKAVQFALSPPEGADTTVGWSLSVKRAGDNMSVAMAQNYCYDRVSENVWLAG